MFIGFFRNYPASCGTVDEADLQQQHSKKHNDSNHSEPAKQDHGDQHGRDHGFNGVLTQQRPDEKAFYEDYAKVEKMIKEFNELPDEVLKVIDDAFNELKPEKPSDMGKLMGFVTPKLKGKADMSFVSKTIKEKLANLVGKTCLDVKGNPLVVEENVVVSKNVSVDLNKERLILEATEDLREGMLQSIDSKIFDYEGFAKNVVFDIALNLKKKKLSLEK